MSEVNRLDMELATALNADARRRIWDSTTSILNHGPIDGDNQSTVLALGYVQSGKTTSITALAAAAADRGYQVIVALLGSTNILLDQNRARLESALGIGTRSDYVWVTEPNPSTAASGKRIRDFVTRGRVCFIPVLKHAGRIRSVAKQLESVPDTIPVLIIDDEADQASLNTSETNESRTYAAIKELRRSLPKHLYVQYTATPYAPLLLDTTDMLSPRAVEFLAPGRGYTGGKEFFLDNATTVVRDVPLLDEQASRNLPIQLQLSLTKALAAFLAGAALLTIADPTAPPVSMLVHSTARNDVQARYEFLLRRQLTKWRTLVESGDEAQFPELVREERIRLVRNGAIDAPDADFLTQLRFVLREATTWLVNSAADVNRVDWTVAPIHILVGGNKLDRGFTVEGLTVTYMNRPASKQVDTLEQRARAFGYRGDLLPYCQFFASKRTVRSLTEIVHTEEDLRARLRDHIEDGGSVRTWAREIGLLLPDGMVPTRASVTEALVSHPLGWHVLRRPSTDADDTAFNWDLIRQLGLADAPLLTHGRRQFRTLTVTTILPLQKMLTTWRRRAFSPGWLQDEFMDALERRFDTYGRATIMLMDEPDSPRVRKWEDDIGFVNLFQGRDLRPQPNGDFYPGDRNVMNLEENPDQILLQVHRNIRRNDPASVELLALALYLGSGTIQRKAPNV
jgi:hypothetical protein